MRRLVYLMNTSFPTTKAHGRQVARRLASLGPNAAATLVVNDLACPEGELRAAVLERYGTALPAGCRALAVPKKRLTGLAFWWTLKGILRATPPDAVFYTRSYRLAARLIRSRWWHKRPVFFESHKQSGWRKEDPVEGSPYAVLRKGLERVNEPLSLIKKVYRGADKVFFLHAHSRDWAERELGVHGEHLWYALDPPPVVAPTEERPGAFVYAGSLADEKLFPLLLDALERARDMGAPPLTVDVYGGSDAAVAARRAEAARRGVGDWLAFKGRVEPAALGPVLEGYKFGLGLMQGIKAADYAERGCIPLVPSIPSHTVLFLPNQAVFFKPDDAEDLGRVLGICGMWRAGNRMVREFAAAHALEKAGEPLRRALEEPGAYRPQTPEA